VLCSLEKWNRYDDNFNHEAFYKNIVALFEHDPNALWVTETLDWWNRYCVVSGTPYTVLF
jgi:hypothetical protein